MKQHKEVKYFRYIFDCNLSGGTMAVKALNKMNCRSRFLYGKQNVINAPLRRLLCNLLTMWFPNLTKTLSNKIQCTLNKCIQFCLNLSNRANVGKRELAFHG